MYNFQTFFPEVKWVKNMQIYVRIVLNVSFCKWSRCGCFTKILIFVTCKAVQNAFQCTWKQIPQVLSYVFLKIENIFFVKLKYWSCHYYWLSFTENFQTGIWRNVHYMFWQKHKNYITHSAISSSTSYSVQ